MRRFQRWHIWLPLLLWMATAPPVLHAQTLIISPEDQTLVITGTLGTNATGFSRNLTLTLIGGEGSDAKQIQVRRSDLTRKGETGEIIDRGNVVVGNVALKRGQPQDVGVTINNITRPGTYEGTIKFWLPEQTEEAATVVKLSLRVAPKIDVKPPPAAAAQVAHCGLLPCSWSGWLPQNLVGDKRGLLLDNQTPDRVVVVSQDLILRGVNTGYVVTGSDIRPSISGNSLPANSSVPVELEILNRDALPPDRYIGSLRLGLKDADSPIPVSLTIDVRDAPWLPLVVLLLGVMVGRLIKNMSAPEAVLQVKLLKRLYRLQNAVQSLQSERDCEILQGRLDDLRARIESANETEQALTQELDKLEVGVRLLRRLEELERQTSLLSNAALRAEIKDKIDAATMALLKDQVEECQRLITEIEVSLRQAYENVADDAVADAHIGSALNFAREASTVSTEAREAHDAPPPPQPDRPTQLLAMLAGTDLMSADARYWVWRPIFFLLFLLLLTMLGLKTLYIDGGANFGGGGVYDYLGLFLWGLSADVVQRTLQNLPLSRS
jgi:hypothetical protein